MKITTICLWKLSRLAKDQNTYFMILQSIWKAFIKEPNTINLFEENLKMEIGQWFLNIFAKGKRKIKLFYNFKVLGSNLSISHTITKNKMIIRKPIFLTQYINLFL
jgi:hypothetical protein